MKNSVIDKLIDKELCVGCGLCASLSNNKITMTVDNGLYLPKIDEEMSDEEVQKFEQICPMINQSYQKVMDNNKNFTKTVGFNIGYYHGYSTDRDIQFQAATGGGITGFLLYLIKEDIVDVVLQIKTGKDAFSCQAVVSKNANDVESCKGSRYAPSCLLSDFKNVISQFDRIAVVGKPCDLRAIDNFLASYPEYKNKLIIKINFLCGGLPKIDGTYQILNALGCDDFMNIEEITYRGNGWPGEFTATKRDNQEKLTMSYDDSWGKYLGKNILLGCKLCIDSVGDCADISFGDGWKTNEKGYPVFNEENGIDLIITRTLLAEKLLKGASEKKYLFVEKADIGEFSKIQPSQHIRRTTAKYKLSAARVCGLPVKGIDKDYVEYISDDNIAFKKKVRSFLGTIKRIKRVN